MSFASPFLVLPTDSRTDSASSGSSSSSSLFAGDSQYSNSTDITPPRSPTREEPKLLSKTNENEQVSHLDDEATPKTPNQSAKTGIFPFSPLLRIQLQEDDTGYESESEDEGSPRSPRPNRYRRALGNPSSLPAGMRGVTAPVTASIGEDVLFPSCVTRALPTILRQNRPSMIDLAVIPPCGDKRRLGKAAIGLGLGLPSNCPIPTFRALTEPVQTSPSSRATVTNLLPCRPFPPPSPRTGEIQNPRLGPTVILGSPSPIEMLPSRFSYFQSPNRPSPHQGSQLPRSPLSDAIPEKRFQENLVSGMPSPMELYSSWAFDTVYPRNPFVSPEACPSFTADDGGRR